MSLKRLSYVIDLCKEFRIKTVLQMIIAKILKNDEMYIRGVESELKNYLKNDCSYGVSGKMSDIIPVWIFWWQGYEQMPELCKICYESVRQNMPECSNIILITADNYKQYVDIPEVVINKVKNGIYTITLFSDLLRNQLLYKYGGLWIDATVFCTKPITTQFLQSGSFWSVKLDKGAYYPKSIGTSITQNKWTGFIQKAPINSKINYIIYNGLLHYMESHNVLIEYFIQNLMLRILYESDIEISESIDELACSNFNLYDLGSIMSEPYDEKKWKEICQNTDFMKLSWKSIYQKEIDGQITYWGHLAQTIKI